jgi:hypothetical protein
MATVQCKITYRIDSNATQVATLMTCLALYCRVYNALWMNTAFVTRHRKHASISPRCARRRPPGVGMPHLRPLSMRNPDKRPPSGSRWLSTPSFAAFFRRVEAGKTAGYPPCKSLNRFSGWGWLEVARQGYYQGNGLWWHFPVRYERYPDAG